MVLLPAIARVEKNDASERAVARGRLLTKRNKKDLHLYPYSAPNYTTSRKFVASRYEAQFVVGY